MKGFEKDLYLCGNAVAFQAAAAQMETIISYARSNKPPDSPLNDIQIDISDNAQHRALQSVTEGI